MKVPTIKQFNAWSDKDKAWYINYETDGKHKFLPRSKGFFPVIFYFHLDVAILYDMGKDGVLISAEAVTIKEANDRLLTFGTAITAMTSKN